MKEELVVDEGDSIVLERREVDHVRRTLGGLVEIHGDDVTVSRVVGHLRLPTGRTLRIRSAKAPASSVLAWAAYADPRFTALRTFGGRVPIGGGDGDIATLLARLLVLHLEDAVLRHGLLRQYRRSLTDTETVRGRIDFARLARQGANLARVPCEVWDRSEATPLNRFFAAALAACRRDPLLREACEPGLSRVQSRMAAVQPGVDRALLDGSRELDRSEQPFAPVLALARMLLSEFGLVEGNEHLGGGFLVNLETLFERAVVRAFRENGIDVVAKSPLRYSRWDGNADRVGSAFEIDALCRGLPGGDVVVDAKYKRRISSGNLHQMIAYTTLTGATRAALVMPAGFVADRRAYAFVRPDGVRVTVDVLELATDARDLGGWRASARHLAVALLKTEPTGRPASGSLHCSSALWRPS